MIETYMVAAMLFLLMVLLGYLVLKRHGRKMEKAAKKRVWEKRWEYVFESTDLRNEA